MTLCYAQNYDKIHFSCMHPGWADTEAVRTSIPDFYEAVSLKIFFWYNFGTSFHFLFSYLLCDTEKICLSL